MIKTVTVIQELFPNDIRSKACSLKKDVPNILLINPWIHDFAAYDYWARPLGLLYLAAILRQHGCKVSYIDCLERFHPESRINVNSRSIEAFVNNQGPVREKKDGRGPYLKTPIAKPAVFENVPRNYCRYGIKPEWFLSDLKAMEYPDLILVTSLMTYWYPGVRETIDYTRKVFPEVPLVVGGIYATLCYDHAVKHLGADLVVSGRGENNIFEILKDFTGYSVSPRFDPLDLSSYPYPAFDLQRYIPYVCLMTSRGCPFSCAYCASGVLDPQFSRRSPENVLEEIRFWHKTYGVINFAFYDDALLVNSEEHACKIFEALIREKIRVRFHTPNALHICEINKKISGLMFQAGFSTIRLGLETTMFEKRNSLDHKVTEIQFYKAVENLLEAGFKKKQIGAYLLTGLPGQNLDSVLASIECVKNSGITPVPAYYSPIPHTRLWNKAIQFSRYDLESDPIFTNNAVFPCRQEEFSWKILSCLKQVSL